MYFLFISALVALSFGILAVAVMSGSAVLFLGAAVLSAVGVIVLWRRIDSRRSSTFVEDLPPRVVPDWSRPVRSGPRVDEGDGLAPVPDVAIDSYDELVAAEILPSLETLSVEQLRAVIARERHGMRRDGIIRRAEKLIDLTEHGPEFRQAELRREASRGLERGRSGPGLSL
jgi:hypothetical protein